MAAFDRTRIQTALRTFIATVKFWPVTYVAGAPVVDTTAGAEQTPTLFVNETSSTFDTNSTNRQTLKQQKSNWLFQATLDFNKEVVLEVFEKLWERTPPKLARDPTNGLDRAVILRLRDATYSHAVQQEGTGTRATYTFEAELSPI